MLDPNATRHVRRRRLLQEGPEQLRADGRLRLGRDQGRQDGGSRRLLADVRQRGHGDGRARGRTRERRPQHRRHPEQPVRDRSSAACRCRRRRRSCPSGRWPTSWRSARPACSGASIRTSSRRTSTRSASASSASSAGSTAVEARYVGTFGREIWRGIDYNQIKIQPGVPRRLQPRPLQRLPGAAGGSGVQPGVQPDRARAASR